MIHLYYHGGSGNHGCEAIVRSTLAMLKKCATLHTSNIDSDRCYGLDQIAMLKEDVPQFIPRRSLQYLLFALHHKLTDSDYLYTRFSHDIFFANVHKGDICLSIGGDNYCYGGQETLAHYNKILRKKGAKTVLWGCSVEPDLIKDSSIARDLARYDLITARESISFNALRAVNPNTVLVADPAFQLSRVDLPLPDGWVEGNMVGINASPLILKSGNETLVMDAYRNLIHSILKTTQLSVVLIPHVVLASNDDCDILEPLYKEFRHTGRVILLRDHNCMELKGYIARCRLFIGARTHATIAAYSSCVPTLALSYSVKSRGIAQDLFGSEESYVIPVRSMISSDAFAKGFTRLLENENHIRHHLEMVMPAYRDKSLGAVQILRRMEE